MLRRGFDASALRHVGGVRAGARLASASSQAPPAQALLACEDFSILPPGAKPPASPADLPCVAFTHGVFGRALNLRTFAKGLLAAALTEAQKGGVATKGVRCAHAAFASPPQLASPPPPAVLPCARLHRPVNKGAVRLTQTLATTRVSSARNGRRGVLLDLRNHGRSGGRCFAPPHTLQAAAADLQRTFASMGVAPAVLVGHSLGGKTALAYAGAGAAADEGGALRQAWVLDALPGPSPSAAGDASKVLAALRAVPGPFPTREAAVVELHEAGVAPETGRWLSGSLEVMPEGEREPAPELEPAPEPHSSKGARRRPPPLRWAINVEGAGEMLDSYRELDFWPLLEAAPAGTAHVHVVQAERGDLWQEADVERLRAARHATHHLLRDAGHNVHVDNPVELVKIMAPRLAEALWPRAPEMR